MTIGDGLHAITARLATAATPHRTLLTGGPITLRISSTSPEPLSALAAALTPYLQPAGADHDPAHTIERISIHADPTLVDRLHQIAGRPGDASHGVQLARTVAGAGRQYREAFLLWRRATPHTSHLVLERPGPATDRVMLRLVRGIAGRCLITAGWVPLHAAAAVTCAGLIVLAGPSGAGKTTALLQLLADRLGYALVTNDKVYLTIDHNSVNARALPTSLALRPDTAAMFPALGHLATPAALSHVDNHPGHHGADHRTLISPRSLADAFGVPLRSGGIVAAIVAISYRGTSRRSWWRRTDPARALDAVTGAYLDDWFIDEPHEHSRLREAPTPLPVAHHITLRRVASTVPIIELNAGSDTSMALHAVIADLVRPAN